MPHSNVFDARVYLSNSGDSVFQPFGKCIRLGFKGIPSIMVLAFAAVVDVLPIIINNKAAYVNVVLR